MRFFEAGIVIQQAIPLSDSSGIPYGCQSFVLAALLPISSLLMTWKSSKGCPKSLGPWNNVRNREEAPASWLLASSPLAIVAISEGNQRMGDLYLSSLCQIWHPIFKNNFKKKYYFWEHDDSSCLERQIPTIWRKSPCFRYMDTEGPRCLVAYSKSL